MYIHGDIFYQGMNSKGVEWSIVLVIEDLKGPTPGLSFTAYYFRFFKVSKKGLHFKSVGYSKVNGWCVHDGL